MCIVHALTWCSGQTLICTRIMTRIPSLQKLLKIDDKITSGTSPWRIILPFPRSPLIQRLNCPEITPLSESFTIPRSTLLISDKTDAATKLFDHRLHSRRLLRRQVIPHFKHTTTPIPTQAITENSRNHSCNQEHNPGHYKEVSTCKSYGYENPYDSRQQ